MNYNRETHHFFLWAATNNVPSGYILHALLSPKTLCDIGRTLDQSCNLLDDNANDNA